MESTYGLAPVVLWMITMQGLLISQTSGLYSMAHLNIESAARRREDSHKAQQQNIQASINAVGSCSTPCNTHNCPIINPEACSGRIVKDHCDCCPVCNESNVSVTVVPGQRIDDVDVGQHEVVLEDSEACKQIDCPRQQMCLLNIQGIPVCRCPSSIYCKEKPRKDVCSEENKTYRSLCFLKMEACETNRKIGVKHKGPCEADVITREERKRLKEENKDERRVKKQRNEKRKTLVNGNSHHRGRDTAALNKEGKRQQRRKDRNSGKIEDRKNRRKITADGVKELSKDRKEELRQERRRHRRKLRKIMKKEKEAK